MYGTLSGKEIFETSASGWNIVVEGKYYNIYKYSKNKIETQEFSPEFKLTNEEFGNLIKK